MGHGIPTYTPSCLQGPAGLRHPRGATSCRKLTYRRNGMEPQAETMLVDAPRAPMHPRLPGTAMFGEPGRGCVLSCRERRARNEKPYNPGRGYMARRRAAGGVSCVGAGPITTASSSPPCLSSPCFQRRVRVGCKPFQCGLARPRALKQDTWSPCLTRIVILWQSGKWEGCIHFTALLAGLYL